MNETNLLMSQMIIEMMIRFKRKQNKQNFKNIV